MSDNHITLEALDQVTDLGGIELLNKLIEMFHDTILERLAAADEAISDNRLDDLHREFHSIRSSAGNLGAQKLSDACLESESAIKEGRELPWADKLEAIKALHALAYQELVDYAENYSE